MKAITSYKKMNFHHIFFFIIILVFIANNNKAELSKDEYSFSSLFKNTEIIINSKVKYILVSENRYKMMLEVNGVLYGDLFSKQIEVVSKLVDGYNLEDSPYLETGIDYILFLNKKDDEWIVTNKMAGVFKVEYLKDVKLLVTSYSKNKTIFTSKNTNDLKNVFNEIEKNKIKQRVAYDLELKLTKLDKNFVSELYYMDDENLKIFGLTMIGRLDIFEMRKSIEELVENTTSDRLKFNGIIALGNFRDKKSIGIIIHQLRNENQGIRAVSIDALGKIGDEKMINPLTIQYQDETDYINRIAIIEAIQKLKDSSTIKKTFSKLINNGQTNHEREMIKKVINEL